MSLDVQFLPDVDIECPECHGSRYSHDADLVRCHCKNGNTFTLPEAMGADIAEAIDLCSDFKSVSANIKTLDNLGLGYLTLGEATTSLSGGEAQRLKLASEMGKQQTDTVFVFDEPTIGLHPLDVRKLLEVFDQLLKSGATVIVIEHDLDVIRNANYIIDMGPGGGVSGGTIVACGTPSEIKANASSMTGRYI